MRKGYFITTLLIVCSVTFQQSLAQNVEKDKKIGAESAKVVEQQYGIYKNNALSKYVTAIGDRLVNNLEENLFDFKFQVADDPIPNAFALPGGYVYVSRGLLSLVTSEDELACVMAHEIIHVTQRHSVKQRRNSVLPGILEMPGEIVGGLVSKNLGDLINLPIQTSNSLYLSSYGRSQETESDTKGIKLAAKSGYDPAVMSDILVRVSAAMELITEQKETKGYFDSHPYTPDRAAKINKTVRDITWTKDRSIATNFPNPLNGMTFGANPANGVFVENKFLHPELNFTIEFPEQWYTDNQPNTVGAIHPNRQAVIYLELEDPKLSAKEHGEIFIKEFKKQYRDIPLESGSQRINSNTGYEVSLLDRSGKEPTYFFVLWLEMNNLVFKLTGFSTEKYEEDLQQSAESIRNLSDKERSSIRENIINIEYAESEETLTGLSERTKNSLNLPLTAIMNGTSENTSLVAGQAIKIVRSKIFSTN